MEEWKKYLEGLEEYMANYYMNDEELYKNNK